MIAFPARTLQHFEEPCGFESRPVNSIDTFGYLQAMFAFLLRKMQAQDGQKDGCDVFLGQDRRCVLWNLTSCYCNCHLRLKVSPKNQERATKGWNSFLCHFRCLSRNYETLPFVVRTCCSGESSPRTHKERQYLDCSWIVAMRWALFSHDDNYHPNENLTFNLSMKIELIAIKFQVITEYSILSLHIHHTSFFRVTNIFSLQ